MAIINIKDKHRRQKGYSLLEVLVVITIIGIVLPAVFSIITVILRQQLTIYELSTVKREGDGILLNIKDKINKEAIGVTNSVGAEQCTTVSTNEYPTPSSNPGSNFTLKANSNQNFYYNFQSGSLNLSVNTNSLTLHSTKVQIENFRISCYKKTNTSPVMIRFSYTVKFNRTPPNPALGTVPSLTYQGLVALRTDI